MGAAFPHWPGQFKQSALAMVSRGASMVEYWHWHTLPFGIENHWGGILPHSLQPGRTFASFKETAKTLDAVSALGPLQPAAEVAIVVSTASKWLFEYHGPVRQANGMADPHGYVKTLQSVYEVAFNSGYGVRILGDNQLPFADGAAAFAAKHPVMVLHSLYSTSDEVLEFAREYAAAGGHLVVGPRTGYAKTDGVIRTVAAPAILGEAGGVTYSEYSMLAKSQAVVDGSGKKVGAVWAWFDELQASAEDTQLRADHPFFGEFAAVASKAHGSGKVTFLASFLDQELAGWLGGYLAADLPVIDAPTSASPSVVVNRATTAEGRQVNFVFNWGWQPAHVTVSQPQVDVETGEALAAGTSFELGAWGVRVLLQG
jgi:beta-galactosidase